MVVDFTTCVYGVGFYNMFTVLHVYSGTGLYRVIVLRMFYQLMQNWHWKLNVASYFSEIEHTICQRMSLCFTFPENIP
jgi:hypothetical protein